MLSFLAQSLYSIYSMRSDNEHQNLAEHPKRYLKPWLKQVAWAVVVAFCWEQPFWVVPELNTCILSQKLTAPSAISQKHGKPQNSTLPSAVAIERAIREESQLSKATSYDHSSPDSAMTVADKKRGFGKKAKIIGATALVVLGIGLGQVLIERVKNNGSKDTVPEVDTREAMAGTSDILKWYDRYSDISAIAYYSPEDSFVVRKKVIDTAVKMLRSNVKSYDRLQSIKTFSNILIGETHRPVTISLRP